MRQWLADFGTPQCSRQTATCTDLCACVAAQNLECVGVMSPATVLSRASGAILGDTGVATTNVTLRWVQPRCVAEACG